MYIYVCVCIDVIQDYNILFKGKTLTLEGDIWTQRGPPYGYPVYYPPVYPSSYLASYPPIYPPNYPLGYPPEHIPNYPRCV